MVFSTQPNSRGKPLNFWSEAYTGVLDSAPKKVEEKAVKMDEWEVLHTT